MFLHAPGQDQPITIGIGLIVAGAILLWTWYESSRPNRLIRPELTIRMWSALAIIIGGASLVGWGAWDAATLAAVRNPVPSTALSLQRGRDVYAANCVSCHGSSGLGDGPSASLFDPPPANLRLHMAQGHSDGELFDWISNGIGGTAMPGYRNALPEDDRWTVINYIRTFAE